MGELEVKASKLTLVMVILLGLFFVPMSVGMLVSGISRGFKVVPLGIGLACLAMFALVAWLAMRGHRKSVRRFTGSGLVRNDGREFAWTDLSRVVNQLHRRNNSPTLYIWRTEIQFTGGESAWLIPAKVSNYGEVRAFVDNLRCEHSNVNV